MRSLLLIVIVVASLGGCSSMSKVPKSPEKTPPSQLRQSNVSRQIEKDRALLAKTQVEGGLTR